MAQETDKTETANLGAEASIAPPKVEKSKMAKRRDLVLGIAVFMAILVPVWFAVAALGTKFGLLDWKFALGVMIRKIAPALIFITLGLGVVGAVLMLIARPFAGWKRALVALLIPGLAFAQLANVRKSAAAIPPIHDISTDPLNPLQFSAATLEARTKQGETNPIVAPTQKMIPADPTGKSKFAGLSVADAQKRAYPNIAPLIISGKSIAEVGEAVKASARQMGWKTTTASEVNLGTNSYVSLEATATTFWFGFNDDVAISVRPNGNAVRVDVRSISRVGVSDLGANAKRIDTFLKAVRAKTD